MNTQLATVTQLTTNVDFLREQDCKLVETWLYGKAANTQRNYHRAIDSLLVFPMRTITLSDMQALVTATTERCRPITVAAIKSLWRFASEAGYIAVNPAIALKTPKQRDTLTDRILPKEDILRMLDRTENKRDHALIRLMYHSGIRVSEACNLRWSDLREVDDYVIMDIWGKGSKLRHVVISEQMYCDLVEQATDAEYVFASRKGGHVQREQAERIVHDAGIRAGIAVVTPHFMRHANCSHALEAGAPITVVQASLGHSSLLTTQKYVHVRPDAGSSQYISV